MSKTEVIKWHEFFQQEERKEERKTTTLIPLATSALLLLPMTAEASAISDRIVNAFDPIIELVKGVSYPICFLMISGSFVLVMIGQKSKGLSMLKWAAVGYIGLQFAPSIMHILIKVGEAMGKQ